MYVSVCVCVFVCVTSMQMCLWKERVGFPPPPPPPSRLLTLNLFDFVHMCLSIEFLTEKEREEVRGMGGRKGRKSSHMNIP